MSSWRHWGTSVVRQYIHRQHFEALHSTRTMNKCSQTICNASDWLILTHAQHWHYIAAQDVGTWLCTFFILPCHFDHLMPGENVKYMCQCVGCTQFIEEFHQSKLQKMIALKWQDAHCQEAFRLTKVTVLFLSIRLVYSSNTCIEL